MAKYANRLAEKVTIYTNGNEAVAKEIEAAISAFRPSSKARRNFTLDSRKIAKLVKLPKGAEIEVILEDGTRRIEGFIAHKPKSRLNGKFAEQLGLDLTPQGDAKVNAPFNESSIVGVFAAGDTGAPMKSVSVALSSGAVIAAGLAAQLEGED